MAAEAQPYLGTGRRKTSIARVRLFAEGSGKLTINGRNADEYLCTETLLIEAMRPLVLTERAKTVDVAIRATGGGVHSQAGAISHGITRALLKLDSNLRSVLKKEGLITRDPRMKERKKPGQPGARKRFQYSKR